LKINTKLIIHLTASLDPANDPQDIYEYEGAKVIKFWYDRKLTFRSNKGNNESKEELKKFIDSIHLK